MVVALSIIDKELQKDKNLKNAKNKIKRIIKELESLL